MRGRQVERQGEIPLILRESSVPNIHAAIKPLSTGFIEHIKRSPLVSVHARNLDEKRSCGLLPFIATKKSGFQKNHLRTASPTLRHGTDEKTRWGQGQGANNDHQKQNHGQYCYDGAHSHLSILPLKALILSLLCCAQAFAGYGFHRSITIDHTQVGSSDSTNFPVVLSGTYAYLATVANSGNVQSSSGFDVVYKSDSGCTTLLNFERVTYTAASGLVQFWINVPTVSHTSDTVFYECYGNGAITTDQSNATGTWNTNFKAVYHFETVPTSPDSTGSNNGVATGNTGLAPTAAAGLIGNAASGNITSGNGGSNPRAIDVGTLSNLYNGSNTVVTTSFWVNIADVTTNPVDFAIGELVSSPSGAYYVDDLGKGAGVTNKIEHTYSATNSFANYIQLLPSASPTLANNTWYYVVAVLDLTTHANSNIYLNGTVQTQTINTVGTPPAVYNTPVTNITFLRLGTGVLNGLLDEVHYANVSHSADWITAEYNNQKSGSTFLSISSAVTTASNAIPVVM